MTSRLRYYLALCLAVIMLAGCSSGGLPDAPAVSPTSAPTEPLQPTATAKPKATSTTKPRATNTPKATATRGKSPAQPTKAPTKAPTRTPTPIVIIENDTPTPEDVLPTEQPLPATPTKQPLPATPTEVEPNLSPTPAATDFVFVDQSNYTDLDGNAVIVGLIQYKGDIAIGGVEIVVELEDADHALLSTESAESVPSLVQPGGFIPFKAVFIDPPANFEYYNTTVQGDEVDPDILDLYTDKFEVTQASLIQSNDPFTPKIVGKVKNIGSTSADYTEVVAALLDDEGNVLDVGSSFTTLTSLDKGQQSAFEIRFDNGEGGTKYEIVVTALVGN